MQKAFYGHKNRAELHTPPRCLFIFLPPLKAHVRMGIIPQGHALVAQQLGLLGPAGSQPPRVVDHPVAGDPVYGPHNCITSLHGQCLHAKTLGFVHPITGEHLRFDSELPDYFTRFLTTLRQRTGGNTL